MSTPCLSPLAGTDDKHKVDLVCCLTSKHERSGGGAGSLSEIYVADGTGFSSSMPGNEWAVRRDAALLKGMRAALGKPAWSPGNPRPPPFPAHLKIEVTENKQEVSLVYLVCTRGRAWGGLSSGADIPCCHMRCCLSKRIQRVKNI